MNVNVRMVKGWRSQRDEARRRKYRMIKKPERRGQQKAAAAAEAM
jgi:hypothetical protein